MRPVALAAKKAPPVIPHLLPRRANRAEISAVTLARVPNGTDAQDPGPFLKSHLRDPLRPITQPIAAKP